MEERREDGEKGRTEQKQKPERDQTDEPVMAESYLKESEM